MAMEEIMNDLKPVSTSARLRRAALAGVAVLIAGSAFAMPALAHDRDGDRDWRRRPHYDAPRPYYYAPPPRVYYGPPPPAYYYAPPRAYYAPPPVYYAPPAAGISLTVPLRF